MSLLGTFIWRYPLGAIHWRQPSPHLQRYPFPLLRAQRKTKSPNLNHSLLQPKRGLNHLLVHLEAVHARMPAGTRNLSPFPNIVQTRVPRLRTRFIRKRCHPFLSRRVLQCLILHPLYQWTRYLCQMRNPNQVRPSSNSHRQASQVSQADCLAREPLLAKKGRRNRSWPACSAEKGKSLADPLRQAVQIRGASTFLAHPFTHSLSSMI